MRKAYKTGIDTSFLKMICVNSMKERIYLKCFIYSTNYFSKYLVSWQQKSGSPSSSWRFSIASTKPGIFEQSELIARTQIAILKHHCQVNG